MGTVRDSSPPKKRRKKNMKKLITGICMAAILIAGAIGLAACEPKTITIEGPERIVEVPANPDTKTAVVGIVGVEKHTYFPYSIVTVDKNNAPIYVEIGECFGPSGKAWIETATTDGMVAYNNPWYPGFSTIVTAFYAAADDAERTAAVADKYISIAGDVFALSWRTDVTMTKRTNSYSTKEADTQVTVNVLTFKKGDLWLTDAYLAEHMDWYLKAITTNKMFPCDASGVKTEIGGKLFQDGAPRKNDLNTVYNATRGLTGPQFSLACAALADFAVAKNFNIEYVDGAADRPQRIKDFNYQALIDQFPVTRPGMTEVVTQSSSLSATTYLHYGKAYISTAVAAFNAAKAL